MGHSHLNRTLYAIFLSLVSTLSHADLIDRGGGLIYDDVLDITWLQDTNYALNDPNASAEARDGMMIWYEANAWVDSLSYYDEVRGVAYDDWRLPTASPINGNSFNYTVSNDGTTDKGYARTTTDGSDGGWRDSSGTPVSELGYMYYVNLVNPGKCDPDRSACRIQDPENWDSFKNLYTNFNPGPFTNFSQLVLDNSPTATTGNYAVGPQFFDEAGAGLSGDYEWVLSLKTGERKLLRNNSGFDRLAAWAVRDGDVITLLRCDLNVNGKADAGDLSQVLRMVAGIIPEDLDCDLDNGGSGDGVVSTGDVVIITRIVLGIIPAILN